MPTERFFRLPKEKQEAIRRAAFNEFKRVLPEAASINKIIREADISRGSFYTYFTDKEELLEWLIESQIKAHLQFYREKMKECDGDVWQMLDALLGASIDRATDEGFLEIIGNLIKSSSFAEYFRRGLDAGPPGCGQMERQLKELYDECNKEKCPLDFERFQDLMEMSSHELLYALKLFFTDKLPREQVETNYRRRLDILRYGACQKS
ncbi:MAG: TetR/AcrR family transcriptional regulator [Lachnospiraceae bacterium]|jgi:AcrR family transcriptional regulator|nr:TetR/AcrR family transcriptional regulator [Lachnospiraceae bacterium]